MTGCHETRTSVIRSKLLAWFRREKRRLPWRGTADPYRIWVSEVMLQQTTVAAVQRRYTQFLQRFPSLPALARAREDSVLAAWSGLGYYARARNLWRAARQIVQEHGRRFPRDPAVLRRLPGFGEYMSAAVASLAFGAHIAAADANVTRVVSRLFAIGGDAGRPRQRRRVLERARTLLPKSRPGDLTAALMDLGQLVCTSRRPRCPACPLLSCCEAARSGNPERFPQRPRKNRLLRVFMAAVCARRNDRALLVRREGSFLAGLWEFPSAQGPSRREARRRLAERIRPLGLKLAAARPSAAVRHTVVNRKLSIEVFRLIPGPSFQTWTSGSGRPRWFRAKELSRAAIPTLTRKIGCAAGFLAEPNCRTLKCNRVERLALSRSGVSRRIHDPDLLPNDAQKRHRLRPEGAPEDVGAADRLYDA